MKEKLKNKKVIVVSSIILVMTIVVLLVITLKDSYAYYGTSNELEIVNAKIGKLKPTIDKVYIEEENKQYTNNPNPNVTITWSDDNITEYCVTTGSICDVFTQLSDLNNKSITAPITLSGEGPHTVNAYIKNKYGYTSAAVQSSITLDTTAPTISNLSTTEITETSATIKVTANSGDISGIKQYCYSTTNSSYICNDMNSEEITFTITNLEDGTDYTVYVYLTDNAGNSSTPITHTFTTISAGKSVKDIILANSSSLESEQDLVERNARIKAAEGTVEDDLRRFVGTKDKVTDNFICFGTNNQSICKNNMDNYMYRIIGIDSQNRLKVIKATKIVQGVVKQFSWNANKIVDVSWEDSDLYKGLESSYFKQNNKYNYMQEEKWTNLISLATYYTGDASIDNNTKIFICERNNNFVASIGLMYLSDYKYANKEITDQSNWLSIANALNGKTDSLGSGASAPAAEYERTMTKGGQYGGNYRAWSVAKNGSVSRYDVDITQVIRPSFYLKSNIKISGNGTIDNPYYITNVN